MPIYLGGTLIPTGAENLNALDDVTISGTPAAGAFLRHNGTAFINVAGLDNADIPVATNSAVGGVSITASTGLNITAAGALSTAPATSAVRGAVIPDGTNISVSATGAIDIANVPVSTLSGTVADGNLPGRLTNLPSALPADPDEDREYLLQWDDSASSFVWAQYTPASFSLDPATNSMLGGVKVPSDSDIEIDGDGNLTLGLLDASSAFASGTVIDASHLPADLFETHVFDPGGSLDSNYTNLKAATNLALNTGELWILTAPAATDANSYIYVGTNNNNAATDDNDWVPVGTGEVDLATTTTASTVVVTNTAGNNATIATASSSSAGVINTDHYNFLESFNNTQLPAATNGSDTRYVARVQDTDAGSGITKTVTWVEETDTNTFRTVTAGGNTLGATETLAFTAGTGISISEDGGAVTIANTVSNTFRPIIAASNTLAQSESLTLNAGSGLGITEADGVVTYSLNSSISADVIGDLTGTADVSKESEVTSVTHPDGGDLTIGTTTDYAFRTIPSDDFGRLTDAEKAGYIWLVV